MEVIDPNQFGGIPKSSTLHVLVSMLNNWTQATDGSGAAVRVVLFDYRKAFDFIDHNLLVRKVFNLVIPGHGPVGGRFLEAKVSARKGVFGLLLRMGACPC